MPKNEILEGRIEGRIVALNAPAIRAVYSARWLDG